MSVTVIRTVVSALRTITKSLEGGLENWKLEQESTPSRLQYAKIGQNIEKCPGYPERLGVTRCVKKMDWKG